MKVRNRTLKVQLCQGEKGGPKELGAVFDLGEGVVTVELMEEVARPLNRTMLETVAPFHSTDRNLAKGTLTERCDLTGDMFAHQPGATYFYVKGRDRDGHVIGGAAVSPQIVSEGPYKIKEKLEEASRANLRDAMYKLNDAIMYARMAEADITVDWPDICQVD